ncbi:magnesium transporter NIPA-domain-containing protein [Cryomyces antarcticus]
MDTTAEVLSNAHELYIRAGGSATTAGRPAVYKVVGLILAICSGLFIGVSFVLKKMGLLKSNVKYNEEAGEGYGYLKNAWWWSGMTLMIIGEICNFVAYAFVDAILVTPLGALSVVVTTILSAIFLKERLSFVGKVGCFNCIIGSVVIVINAPSQSSAATIQEMQTFVIAPGFLSYAGVIIVGCAFIAFWAGPRYGKKSMLVYLSICSLIGGLSVVATQGLGAAIVTQIAGTPQFNQWFLYVLLVFVIATLVTEIIYLNKALNIFNAALVTPTYYVFFTSSTIVTSAFLFRGFKGTAASISTVVMGFLQICAGVILLQLAKSAKDVPDAAVFKGDLDQVRTVAEVEEPESEPKADTIRGGAAIIRAMSHHRTKKQVEEVKRIHDEHMEPIGENEQVEWDGLRRRKTVLEPGQIGLRRTKTIHPPLGMTHFPGPEDDASEARTSASAEDDVHPGFFPAFRRKANSTTWMPGRGLTTNDSSAATTLKSTLSSTSQNQREHIYGLPPGLRTDGAHDTMDTAYKSPAHAAIHWAPDVDAAGERATSRGSSRAPPPPPPHAAKRQFSFQNVFHRHHNNNNNNNHPPKLDHSSGGGVGSGASDGDHGHGTSNTNNNRSTIRPISRGGLSFTSRKSSKEHPGTTSGSNTEEERLGLVKGDSANMLAMPEYDEAELPLYDDDEREEDEWQLAGGGGRRGAGLGGADIGQQRTLGHFPFESGTELGARARRGDGFDDDDDDEDDDPYEALRAKGYESGIGGRGGG